MYKQFKFLATLLLLAVSVGTWADTTYKLTKVTTVVAGGLYVFEQGGHVMNNTVSSSALQTTNSYKTVGLTGGESYVWILKTATNGYNLKNNSLTENNGYLNNSSGTGVSFGQASSIWSFNFQADGTVLIQNNSNSDRFLGYTTSSSYAYKAYATSNLDSYPHAINVYKLEEENGGTTTTYTVTFNAGDGTFVGNNDFPNASNTVAAGTYTLPSATPASGYTFDGWTATGVSSPVTGNYTVSGDVDFTAQYSQSSSGSGNTATLTASNLELTGSYTSNTTKTIDGITYVYTDLMKNNSNIQAKASSGTIKNTTAYPGDITSVAITHYGTARATTINGSADGTNWTQVGTGNGSLTADFSGKGYKYFQITRGSNAAYWEKIEITYSTSATTTPSITASDVDITYNATGGSIAYTINNSVDGGSVSAEVTQGDWLTLGQGTTSPISFTCSANSETTARTATVTLTYTYGNNETVTKDVTVTQAAAPVIYSTIPAIFAAATTTETPVYVTFNNWVVSGVSTNGKNVFVTDNSGNGFVLYYNSDMSSTYSAGDILSGTAVSGSLKLYNGFAELLNVDANDLTITSGGTVTAANITMASLAGVNTGALVSYQGLTCSVNSNKYYLSDGTTTLQVFNSLYAFDALEDGKTYNITGVYQQYNSTKEILPRSAADIVEVVITTPSISVATNTINAAYAGASGTIDVTYNNISTVVADVYFYESDGTTPATYNWIDAEINSTTNNVDYVIDANTGAARTAYMKVYAIGDNCEDVYSELITITQAAYVAPAQPGNWVLTNLADLTASDVFVIVGTGNGNTYALPNNGGTNAPSVESVTIVSGTLSGEPAANLQWNISGDATNGYTFYPNGDSENWLYCSTTATSGSNNNIKVGTGNRKAFVLDNEDHLVTNDSNTDRYLSIYFENGTPKDWRGYVSSETAPTTISFYKKQETVTVEITSAGMATFCSDKALDFTGIDNIYAYKASVSGNNISFTRVYEVPAETGVLLRNPNGGQASEQVPVISSATAITGNAFVGTLTQIDHLYATTGDNANYILFNGSEGLGFYQANDNVVGAGKAYLQVPNGAKTFIAFEEEGEATGINNVNHETMTHNGCYNLNGQRVENPTKGLYIVNGKKVVLK